MGSKAPERACILLVKIDADDRRSVISQLHHIAHQLERGDVGSPWISGGYSSGHILSYTENAGPSHDEYFAALSKHLDALDADKQPTQETVPAPVPERECPNCNTAMPTGCDGTFKDDGAQCWYTWWHLKPFGYAPGGYTIKCIHCKTYVFHCDKRASTCLPCATALHESSQNRRPE